MKLIDEPKNKAVITTVFVIKQHSPITYISYDDDGDWQFMGNNDVTAKDALVVSIEEILKHDKTLVNLPDLEKGESVSRKNINSQWIKE